VPEIPEIFADAAVATVEGGRALRRASQGEGAEAQDQHRVIYPPAEATRLEPLALSRREPAQQRRHELALADAAGDREAIPDDCPEWPRS
jgi:hypothetical protein